MELLPLYLQLMIVGWRDECYRQKSGVCIESCVAPDLSGLYLDELDCAVEKALGSMSVTKVVHYVDDLFVFLERGGQLETRVGKVVVIFTKCGGDLKFTFKVPKERVLQYLDLYLPLPRRLSYWLDL